MKKREEKNENELAFTTNKLQEKGKNYIFLKKPS
jgi:hypothetical protein